MLLFSVESEFNRRCIHAGGSRRLSDCSNRSRLRPRWLTSFMVIYFQQKLFGFSVTVYHRLSHREKAWRKAFGDKAKVFVLALLSQLTSEAKGIRGHCHYASVEVAVCAAYPPSVNQTFSPFIVFDKLPLLQPTRRTQYCAQGGSSVEMRSEERRKFDIPCYPDFVE